MSREEIDHGDYHIAIGWDSPFDTFFAQVFDKRDKESEEPIIWLGSENGEFRDIQTFTKAFEKKLLETGVIDFSLSTGQTEQLEEARQENPSGAGMSRKTAKIRELLKKISP